VSITTPDETVPAVPDADTPAPAAATAPRRGRIGVTVAAVGTIALGGAGLWQAAAIRQPSVYQALGPRVFPTVVSLGLLAVGVALLARLTVTPDRWLLDRAADEAATSDLRTPVALVAVLVAYSFALRPAGYVVATTVFFPVAARLLGSGRPVRDAVVGVALSFGLFELFTELLGVRLPAGLLAGAL
jgi:putative tricarboxylic transport membrane protein